MYRVLVHHRNEYGEEPEVVVDVPGVMTILGSYSDFCDGFALMCTNTQGLRLAISRRQDNTVKVYNHTIQDRKKFQLSGLKCKSDDKWISTVKAVFIALQHDGIALPGMDISITGRTAHSDYDTLAAAVAAGFLIAFNDLLDLSLSLNDMLRIAHAANSYSNGSSRLRDLLTLFIIKKKELVLFDLESYNYETMENPFDTEEITTYILDCGIPKNILFEEERKVQEQTKDTMELLRKTMEKGTRLRDYSTRELKYQRGLADENALRYANFTLSESSRVLKAWDALKHNDRNQFSKILLEQQDGIKTAVGKVDTVDEPHGKAPRHITYDVGRQVGQAANLQQQGYHHRRNQRVGHPHQPELQELKQGRPFIFPKLHHGVHADRG